MSTKNIKDMIYAKEYWTNKNVGLVSKNDPRLLSGELVDSSDIHEVVSVVDARTGLRIGRCRRDHPKFLSGEWICFIKNRNMAKNVIEKCNRFNNRV